MSSPAALSPCILNTIISSYSIFADPVAFIRVGRSASKWRRDENGPKPENIRPFRLGSTGDNGDPDNFPAMLLGCDAVGGADRSCFR